MERSACQAAPPAPAGGPRPPLAFRTHHGPAYCRLQRAAHQRNGRVGRQRSASHAPSARSAHRPAHLAGGASPLPWGSFFEITTPSAPTVRITVLPSAPVTLAL